MAEFESDAVPVTELEPSSTLQPKALAAVGVLTFLLIFSFFSLALSGESQPEMVSSESDEKEGWRAFSVVAPVDTGINVYHDHFRTNETYPGWLLDQLGVNKVCELTFNGSWQERYDADRETCWDSLNASDIVYFPGTKIICTSPDADS